MPKELNLYLVYDTIANYSYLIASTNCLGAARYVQSVRQYSKQIQIDFNRGTEGIQVAYLGIASDTLEPGFITGAFIELANP